jgi:hypothetical protein
LTRHAWALLAKGCGAHHQAKCKFNLRFHFLARSGIRGDPA